MHTIRMTPGRRLQLAGLGYLMMYLFSAWHPQGAAASLIAALVFLAVALLLFRAAAPEPLRPDRDPASYHPVQAGKRTLLPRNRLLQKATVSQP
jgi:hypothetical protein